MLFCSKIRSVVIICKIFENLYIKLLFISGRSMIARKKGRWPLGDTDPPSCLNFLNNPMRLKIFAIPRIRHWVVCDISGHIVWNSCTDIVQYVLQGVLLLVDYQLLSHFRRLNHLHRHVFTVLLWSLTPPTMPHTVKFIGWSGRHISR